MSLVQRPVDSHRRSGHAPVRHHPALTLLETLVAIAIVGVLIGLLLPAVQRVRDAAARAACASNLRQLGIGVHLYADVHERLPQGCSYPFLRSPDQLRGQIGLSWLTSILPFVEQNDLWNLAWKAQAQDPSGHADLHGTVEAKIMPVYLCPAEPRQSGGFANSTRTWGLTSYVGVAGTREVENDGVFHRHFTVRFGDITDGTSRTVMIGERPAGPRGIYGSWYANWGVSVCQLAQILPAGRNHWSFFGAHDCPINGQPLRPGRLDDSCDVMHFWSLHLNGANFAFADGSVRFLAYDRSSLLPALATRAGGEIVGDLD